MSTPQGTSFLLHPVLARQLQTRLTKILVRGDEQKPGTISLSIAQVEKPCAPASNKLRAVPSFLAKLGQRVSPISLADIPPREYLARGWDVNNNEWRRVLWPALDKDFRRAEVGGKKPVWKIQWKEEGPSAT